MTFAARFKNLAFNVAHVAPMPGEEPEDPEIATAVPEQHGRSYAEEIAPLNATGDPDGSHCGPEPFLMLAGNLVAGWQIARAVPVAEDTLQRGDDIPFIAAKAAMARFYAQSTPPETERQRDRVFDGTIRLPDASV